ncbi:SMP-30/Gluconolaconase/LRE-like region-domain-containing protein [Emericellopsis atlantica]|uniref:SMP-30/Gluconolaconase/LRE-like region-domain-containing protein n=1 Tax=Emericellopsis atlantica TaxID=2614577 RepID=A0A9P7ZG26_9HYPO|nr:SMP-30/Gluconolaconase/LRE-like region-domain-containing protein [Emericellopsis atlantica]KAG9251464.1 SMP-30/Gluconolaconase/LRE-like region-domain-containing protein [Emericellopsis atlantica]
MAPLRFLARTSPRTVAFARPFSTTSISRFPYKDSQDRESLRPRAQEGSRSTSDDDVANNPDAAFNPRKTRPETEMKAAEEGRGDDASPLENSGANQSFNKPRGDEKSPHDRGLGKEVRKGANMKTFEVTEPFIDVQCGLSEGPYWEREANILRFVDIVSGDVYRVNLSEGPSSLRKFKYDQIVTVTADIEGQPDSFIFGGKTGVGIAKKDSSDSRMITDFWSDEEKIDGKNERMRANDEVKAMGALFRVDLDGKLNRIPSGLTCPNGMSWSKDGKHMYFTDTPTKAIHKYDFDQTSGSLSNKSTLYDIKHEGAMGADGHALDKEGNIWAALWGTGKVVRINPQGEVTAEVKVPVRTPTAVAFCGEDIYITSEKEPEPDQYPESAKWSGMVFKCHVGVKGRELPLCKIKA